MNERKTRPDIYKFEKKLPMAYALLEKSGLTPRDKEIIKGFIDHLRAQNVGIARLTKYIFTMKVIGENLGVPFEQATRKDIERFMAWLYSKDQAYSPQTTNDYAFFLKRFFKFVRFGNVDRDTPYPEEVRWVKKTMKLSESTQVGFLTSKEVGGMIGVCRSIRDRAMLAVGFEAGLRAGELLGMDVGDVMQEERGAKVKIRGKTGERTVLLVASSPLLSQYLETHPLADDPGAPLWVTNARNSRNQRQSWVRWNKTVKALAAQAGIKRRVHNHLLRHGSATKNAQYLTDAQMRVMYGWTMNSKMPSVYIHLNGADLDAKLLAINSGVGAVVPAKQEFSQVTCPKCKEKNSPGTRYCGRCGCPLDAEELMRGRVEAQELASKIDRLLEELASRK
jgi:integrase/recombinase XerD